MALSRWRVTQEQRCASLEEKLHLYEEQHPLALPTGIAPSSAQLIACLNQQNVFLLQQLKAREEEVEGVLDTLNTLKQDYAVAVQQQVSVVHVFFSVFLFHFFFFLFFSFYNFDLLFSSLSHDRVSMSRSCSTVTMGDSAVCGRSASASSTWS